VNRRTALLAVVIIATLALAACSGDPVTKKQQHYAKGTGYLADGKYNEAVLEFRSALQIDPSFADAHHRLGLTYWRKGWIPDARFELEAAGQLVPDREVFNLDLAELLVDLGAADEALRLADAAVDRNADSARAHHLRGRALAIKGDVARAEAAFRQALARDPKLADAHAGLGHLFLKRREVARAEQAFDTALRLRPDHVDALLGLGSLRLERGQVEAARADFERAVRAEPESGPARMALASFYASQGKLEDAITELQGLTSKVAHIGGTLQLAAFYLRAERNDKAIATLLPFAKKYPRLSQVHYLLAIAYLSADRPEPASATLEEIVRRAPEEPTGHLLLGQAYLRRGMGAEAVRELQTVQRLAPAFRDLDLHLANAYLQTASPRDAVQIAEAALKNTPDDPRLYAVLGLARAALQDFSHAHTALQRALDLDPRSVAAHLSVADVYALEGRSEAAVRALEEAVRIAPDDQRARATLYVQLLRDGQSFAEVPEL